MSPDRRHRQRRGATRASAIPPPTVRPMLAGRSISPASQWRWRTFPVFFVFALTFFLTALFCELLSGSRLIGALVVVAAVVLALALAHFFSVRIVAPHVKPAAGRDGPPGRGGL